MNERLFFTSDHAEPLEPIEEISRVALVRDVRSDAGVIPAGSKGTVLSVYGGGCAYCLEFTSPFAALVTVPCNDLLALPGESRADFVAASDKVSD